MLDLTSCITFYSYKGGSGRSTALVNTVMHLQNELNASPENPILIVDADLESAGLTYFFNCDIKFTHQFPESIHTRKVFDATSSILLNKSGDIIFGDREIEDAIPQDVLDKYKEFINESKESAMAYSVDLLKDIKIPKLDITVFQRIVEYNLEFYIKKTSADEGSLEEYIQDKYHLIELAGKFIKIDSQSGLSDEDKSAKIKTVLLDFLPARKFMDVSQYFETKPGTVLFLGVDVSAVESIARNGTSNAINGLLERCTEKGFRAVVFDSGAGTQSTADALHTVSDTIVYCMRPTQQFIKGTGMQLWNYEGLLEQRQEQKCEQGGGGKPVILLPTAVPVSDRGNSLFNDSFKSVDKLIRDYSGIIDNTFCNDSWCLPEVSLFKWHECILGTAFVAENIESDKQSGINEYSGKSDALKALEIYKKLAERIRVNL